MLNITDFAIDVDGCVFNPHGYEQEKYYEALYNISQYTRAGNEGKGPRVHVCSGRDGGFLLSTLTMMGMPDCFSVIESGLAIFHPKTQELIYNPNFTPRIQATFEQILKEKIPTILKQCPGLSLYPWNKANVALDWFPHLPFSIEECYQIILGILGDLVDNEVIVRYSSNAVDMSPRGVDKGSGMQFLAEHENIDLSKVLGVGDSNGDEPMMKKVGYVGCPSNASDECKRLVRKREGYIAQLSYSEGVMEILNHFTQ